jgi:hypothetical protein
MECEKGEPECGKWTLECGKRILEPGVVETIAAIKHKREL